MKITSIHTAVIPNGNILTKTDSSTNTTVNYGYTDPTWADLLTSYKGQTITYDEIGNPLTYRDGMSFTWSEGRQLSTVTKNGSVYNYYYDGEGYRSQKMVNNNSTQYTVIDGVIYGEVTYGTTGATQIYYYYDDGGRAYGFSYNGTMYYYQFNLQGDVTGIYNSNGQLVTEYKYDPWGKVLSVTGSMAGTVGQANPIRYRGYYYDSETGFYFLQSRYYDPETGRFLNADVYVSTGQTITGTNMFAYCGNNPVNMLDENGYDPVPIWAKNIIKGNATLIDYAQALSANPNAWAGAARYQVDLAIEIAQRHEIFMMAYNEHQKRGTTNPSNRNKHENGQTRKQRDNRGEKGDARRIPNPNKRRSGNINKEILLPPDLFYKTNPKTNPISTQAVAAALIIYIGLNDISGVGIADDMLLIPAITIMWDSIN